MYQMCLIVVGNLDLKIPKSISNHSLYINVYKHKLICEFDLNISFQQLFYDCFITHIIRTYILVFKHFT